MPPITVSNLRLGPEQYLPVAAIRGQGDGIDLEHVHGVTISGISVDGVSGQGFVINDSSSIVLSYAYSLHNGGNGLLIVDAAGVDGRRFRSRQAPTGWSRLDSTLLRHAVGASPHTVTA